MKPTILSMVSLLILFLLLVETPQGIRFEEESFAVFHKIIREESFRGEGGEAKVVCKEDEPCSGTKKEMFYNEVQRVHHSLPGFHEDYFGPKNHKSKHH